MQIIYSTNTNFALEFERRKLVDMAITLGLDHPRVLAQSQKLDVLVVESQKEERRWLIEQ